MKTAKHENINRRHSPDSERPFICGAKAPDTPVYEYKVDGIYIHDITVAELEDFYRIYGYKDYIYMRDWIYPPIFLTRLPRDFRSIKDPQNATSSSCKSSALWL